VEQPCTNCGGATVSGALGTIRDPVTYWSEAEAKDLGLMPIQRSSRGQMPVVALRCESCGRLELLAQPM
jgi:hypothetical protein